VKPAQEELPVTPVKLVVNDVVWLIKITQKGLINSNNHGIIILWEHNTL
jgi:hypothetical protein